MFSKDSDGNYWFTDDYGYKSIYTPTPNEEYLLIKLAAAEKRESENRLALSTLTSFMCTENKRLSGTIGDNVEDAIPEYILGIEKRNRQLEAVVSAAKSYKASPCGIIEHHECDCDLCKALAALGGNDE